VSPFSCKKSSFYKQAFLTISTATIICPDDLIATVAALTLAIRVIGGSIGYCV
jgi:hypothetical protein